MNGVANGSVGSKVVSVETEIQGKNGGMASNTPTTVSSIARDFAPRRSPRRSADVWVGPGVSVGRGSAVAGYLIAVALVALL